MTLNKLISKIALKIDPPEPPRTTGNWVIGLNGQLVWDPWDFPEPTEEEAAATLSSLSQRFDDMAAKARARPDYKPPTEEQIEEAAERSPSGARRTKPRKLRFARLLRRWNGKGPNGRNGPSDKPSHVPNKSEWSAA
jgi:hypothetical protein